MDLRKAVTGDIVRQKMNQQIEKLNNHFIICGHGRMGGIICEEMVQNEVPFVVIEGNPEVIASIDRDILFFKGDATQDTVLKEAGIDRARGLISVLSSDAANLYVVLSAKSLSPKIKIVAKASDEGAKQKLIRAGADNVILPYYIGGLQIDHTLLKPAVVDYIEFATRTRNLGLQIDEINIKEDSHIIGRSLDEYRALKESGIVIIAVKRATGEIEFNPASTSVIKQGDILIVMGETKQLKNIKKLV